MSTGTKQQKAAKEKEDRTKDKYLDALERELRLVKNTSRNPDRIKDIEAAIAAFKPAKKTPSA